MSEKAKSLFIPFIAALILGLAFDYLFYGKNLGISFFVFIALLAICFFMQKAYFRAAIPNSIFFLLAPLLFFAFMISVRASEELTTFNFLASFALLLLIVKEATGVKLRESLLADYLKTFLIPFFIFIQGILGLPKIFQRDTEAQHGSRLYPILRGIAITLPILLLFIILFTSADLVFQKYILDLFKFDLPDDLLVRLFLVLLVSFALFGSFAYIFAGRDKPLVVPRPQKKISIGHTEVYILLGSITLLFMVFILVQVRYLFGGESNITELGFTYAQYARRGFFELVVVAIFTLLLAFGLDKYAHGENGHSALFKILTVLLIFEVILIEFSAHKRLALYEDAYGLTTARFYSHALVILLQIIFLELAYKLLAEKQEKTFLFGVFATIVFFLVSLNLINPDARIAKQNIARYHEGEKLDAYYLVNLSVDAFQETSQLLNNPDRQVRIDGANVLDYLKNRIEDRSERAHWQSFHFAYRRAEKIYNSKKNQIETLAKEPPSWNPPELP